MRIEEGAVLETLRRIQGFLDAKHEILSAVNQSNARKRVDELVDKLSTHSVEQFAGRRVAQGETAKQHAMRKALRSDYMLPVAIIAGELLREQPDFAKLRVPKSKTGTVGLATAAYDMAKVADQHIDVFIGEGLAPDFVVQLRDAADRLLQSMDARGQGKGQRAGATAGLKSATKRARSQIRLLDSLVRPKLGTDDTLLREWKSAKHIQRTRSAPSAAPDAEAAATPAPTLTVSSTSAGPVAAA